MKRICILIIFIIILATILIIRIKPNNEKISVINYEIIEDISIIDELNINNNNDRGYEVIEKDNFYYLVIKYGEQPSYYSRLEITKVEIDNKDLKVRVKLPDDEGMGDAFSYPKAIIKLEQKPEQINIIYK